MRTNDNIASQNGNDAAALSMADKLKGADGNGSNNGNNGAGPLFCCPACAYKTTSLRKLGRHRSVNHAGVKYRCEHCDFVTGYQSNYYRHRKQVHNGGMSQSALQAAAAANNNSPSQQQSTTNRHIGGSNGYRGGISNGNGGGVSLPTMPAPFGLSDEHQRLLAAAILGSTNQLRCDRCPFQANTPETLAAHISLLHGADGQRTCGECGITLATKSQWQEHLRTYHHQRSQGQVNAARNDYANIFGSLANNNAAALTAVHLIMAAAATNGSNGGGVTNGYDLNLLASAAALSSADNMHRQQSQRPDQPKSMDSATPDLEIVADRDQSQRYYACVYDCDFVSRSSRQYLHHLRDEHEEKFDILYCDQCDDYATKFVARLRQHQASVHGVEEKPIVDGNERRSNNGATAVKNGNGHGHLDEDEDEMGDPRLSIDLDQPQSEQNGRATSKEQDEIDGLFRCEHCPYATNELPRFKKHSKCHESTLDTRCQFCNFRTVYSWNLDRHVRCHRQMQKYTCRRCSFSQNTRQSMQFHLQHHHDDVAFEAAETQTVEDGDDVEDDWEPMVDVGFEPFVFEKHAVMVNTDMMDNLERENADGSVDDEMLEEDGYEKDLPLDLATDQSPFEHSEMSESGRHSAPTPPALLHNGSSSGGVYPQESRQRVFHNQGMNHQHYRRRQQQHQPSSLTPSPSVLDVAARRTKKFLSEQEAIEIPTDSNVSEFDNDPDIKNRHCSVCGYQGKWISEMIRHKRVHTNERPFKCKYCSRTSKWKADLIRHVAKVHGYRVISKYSRSKTFDDADQNAMKALKEAAHSTPSPTLPGFVNGRNAFSESPALGRHDEASINVDDDMEFEDAEEGLDLSTNAVARKAIVDKWTTGVNGGGSFQNHDEEMLDEDHDDSMKERAIRTNGDHQRASMEAAAAALMFRQLYGGGGNVQLSESSTLSNGSSSPASSVLSSSVSKEIRDIIGSKQLGGALEKYITIKQADGSGEPTLKCRVCPYETKDLHTFRAHTQKHENKKPYLCSTCGYRSNWSSDVHKHIRLKKTGHETAYVIKLNEGGDGESSSPIAIIGRSSSNSDCSSLYEDGPTNRSANSETPSPGLETNNGRLIGQVTWRCLKCDFEHESKTTIIEHLNSQHQQTPPFACRYCHFTSLHRKTCVYHVQSQHNSRDSSIVENLVCEYRPKPTTIGDEEKTKTTAAASVFKRRDAEEEATAAKDIKFSAQIGNSNSTNVGNGSSFDQQAAMAMMAANAAAAAFAASSFGGNSGNGGNGQTKPVDWMQLAQLCFMSGFPMNTTGSTTFASEASTTKKTENGGGTTSTTTIGKEYRCVKCPFVGRTDSDFVCHEKGHHAPNTGLMCYKCVFCEWYAPKKQSIFDHLELHTDEPDAYKAEVERNMFTPLSRKREAEDTTTSSSSSSAESAAANALLGLAKSEKPFGKTGGVDIVVKNGSNGENRRKESSINGNGIYGPDAKRRNSNGGGGGTMILGGGDMDDVMSDFNAIIHAADQDLDQDVKNSNGKSCGGTILGGGRQVFASNSISAASDKLWALKMGNGSSLKAMERGGFDQLEQADIKTMDREAYIHAGEDAFDSIARLGEVVKGEIQKVTAVVDGQVRKMWQCRHCPHMSKRRANVRMHEKKHFKSSAIGVFKCPKCNYRGDKRSLHVHYRVHMSSENGGSATMPELFQCTNCPAIFQSQEDLALHSINHNNGTVNAQFRCNRCSYAVSSSNALVKHARVHDRQQSLANNNNNGESSSPNITISDPKRQSTIANSNRRYTTNSAAIANVIVQHEEIASFVAANSGEDEDDDEEEEDGEETALNLVTRNSSVQSPAFAVESTTAASSPLVGGGGSSMMMVKPKKYLCSKCPAKFTDRTQLNRHIQFHGAKLKFKCDLCDYAVPFPINLTKHMKSHHNLDVVAESMMVVGGTSSSSDNENESEMSAAAALILTDEDEFDEQDEEKTMDDDQNVFDSTNEDNKNGPEDATGLKIKINLGALKQPSSSVA